MRLRKRSLWLGSSRWTISWATMYSRHCSQVHFGTSGHEPRTHRKVFAGLVVLYRKLSVDAISGKKGFPWSRSFHAEGVMMEVGFFGDSPSRRPVADAASPTRSAWFSTASCVSPER